MAIICFDYPNTTVLDLNLNDNRGMNNKLVTLNCLHFLLFPLVQSKQPINYNRKRTENI